MKTIDLVFAPWPRHVPSRSRLENCKIVAHRGALDAPELIENTLPAFDRAAACGIWGIELDIRWTADLVPVVSHDPHGLRLFGDPARIRDLTIGELRERMPLVPTLQQVVERYGKRMHLMIEIKDDPYPEQERQYATLEKVLTDLAPGDDYHFLALDPALFRHVPFADRAICSTVAEVNIHRMSPATLEQGLGGLMGHFLLLTNRMKTRHEQAGQTIGTGFVASRSVLFRELNRGVEWIFSNDPVRLQRIVDECLAKGD